MLLGDEVELVNEALPDEAKTNWDKQTDIGVIERDRLLFRPSAARSS
jgi:hypothetical protein